MAAKAVSIRLVNPSSLPVLDRKDEEGEQYRLGERLERLVQEFLERVQ